MNLDYKPPSWIISSDKLASIVSITNFSQDSEEVTRWRLDEMKAGVTLCQHSLPPLTLFGRVLPDALPNDSQFIVTSHESCSRLHARIAFDQSGSPWLRDLGSNNGTTVNRKELPPQSIGRSENGTGEGSRGVRLFPGDMIQFGASSRCYIIEGPEKYERGHATVGRNTYPPNCLVQQEEKTKQHSQIINNDHDVSWGIDFGSSLEQQDRNDRLQEGDVDSLSFIESSSIPEKHKKLYEKIVAKKYKLANIREENQRIKKKETFSNLSDGQSAQILKNQSKEQELVQEIEELEFDLMSKLKASDTNGPQNNSNTHRKRRRQQDDDIDDEDYTFYDRTNKSIINTNEPNVVETEQSLKEKWDRLFASYEKRRRETARLLDIVREIEMEIQQKSNPTDGKSFDEDLFFLQNDLSVAQNRWNSACETERGIEKDMSSVEALLRVVNIDFVCDRTTGFIGKKKELLTEIDKTKSQVNSRSTTEDDESIHLFQPIHKPENVEVMNAISELPNDGTMRAIHESIGRAKTSQLCSQENKNFGPSSNKGTLAFIATAMNHNSNARVSKQPHPIHQTTHNQSNTDMDTIDNLKDEWIAPDDQDGTGITKLNEKFQGRY